MYFTSRTYMFRSHQIIFWGVFCYRIQYCDYIMIYDNAQHRSYKVSLHYQLRHSVPLYRKMGLRLGVEQTVTNICVVQKMVGTLWVRVTVVQNVLFDCKPDGIKTVTSVISRSGRFRFKQRSQQWLMFVRKCIVFYVIAAVEFRQKCKAIILCRK